MKFVEELIKSGEKSIKICLYLGPPYLNYFFAYIWAWREYIVSSYIYAIAWFQLNDIKHKKLPVKMLLVYSFIFCIDLQKQKKIKGPLKFVGRNLYDGVFPCLVFLISSMISYICTCYYRWLSLMLILLYLL